MDMPTVCTCGELVELDDMRAIGNKLYCAECYEEWKSEHEDSQ